MEFNGPKLTMKSCIFINFIIYINVNKDYYILKQMYCSLLKLVNALNNIKKWDQSMTNISIYHTNSEVNCMHDIRKKI